MGEKAEYRVYRFSAVYNPQTGFVDRTLKRAGIEFIAVDVNTKDGDELVERYGIPCIPYVIKVDENDAVVVRANGIRDIIASIDNIRTMRKKYSKKIR